MMIKTNLSIDVPDLDAGVKFYTTVFEWKEESRPMPNMAVLDAGNLSVCIMAKPAGSKPVPSNDKPGPRDYERHWTPVHLDFYVQEFDEVMRRAREEGAGVEMSFEISESCTKPVAMCHDPFGHGFCVIGAENA